MQKEGRLSQVLRPNVGVTLAHLDLHMVPNRLKRKSEHEREKQTLTFLSLSQFLSSNGSEPYEPLGTPNTKEVT